ncbi:MAG: DUF2182 domain-containing protein [Gammaproteobacteria bacterium]|nr:DUF2182 domain-containing protein [Gammaproteobacteria bacterium]MCZ6852394.1 DUF2182 domain-containing protein [Gammaproteobacteria bacterium]
MLHVFTRDRVWTIVAIGFLTLGAWGYIALLAFEMGSSAGPLMAAMPRSFGWGLTDFLFMFAMWTVMMIAMMLPSAVPMILLFEKVGQRRASHNRSAVAPSVFMVGYLVVWVVFSLAATLLNGLFHGSGLLTSVMGRATPLVAGGLLIAAGFFQWTPLKHACLEHCRSPIGFLMAYWQDGHAGALRMGVHHGMYCVGCCWLLMALLFVLGVMNVAWIAVLAAFVLLEKIVPQGVILSRVTGVFLVLWGGIVLMAGF